VYASSGASVSIVSSMFAIVFLSIMALYPLSLLILLHNRPTLPRRSRRTPFLLTVSTLALSLALIAGVISTDPSSLGYFAAYVAALGGALLLAARWGRLVRTAWWVAEHGLHWHGGADWCVRMMRRAKQGKEVVVFVKSDEVRLVLFLALLVSTLERLTLTPRSRSHADQHALPAHPLRPAERDDGAHQARPPLRRRKLGGGGPLGRCALARREQGVDVDARRRRRGAHDRGDGRRYAAAGRRACGRSEGGGPRRR